MSLNFDYIDNFETKELNAIAGLSAKAERIDMLSHFDLGDDVESIGLSRVVLRQNRSESVLRRKPK